MFPPNIIDHIGKHFPKCCPLCQGAKFQVQNRAYCVMLMPDDITRSDRDYSPIVGISCIDCGHLMLFLPETMGLSFERLHLSTVPAGSG